MPRYKLYPKDGKSSRESELRPSRIEIRVLPLLCCLVLAVIVWCYASGSGRFETAETDSPAIETTVPPEEPTADPAEPAGPPADTEAPTTEV